MLGSGVREVYVPSGSESGRPRLSRMLDGRPLLSWTEPTTDSADALRYAVWEGMGWSAPRTAATGADWFVNWADTPGVIAAGDGRLVAHWLAMHPGGESPYAYDVQISTSAGESDWADPQYLHDDGVAAEHGFVSAVSDAGGSRFVWLDGRAAETTEAMMLRTALLNADGALGESAVLDERVCDCCPTDVALAASGPIVIYRDRSPDEIRDIGIVRLVDGAWTAPAFVHADGWEIAGCPVNGPAVAANGERVVVAWFTGADERPRVQLAFSENGGASFGPPFVVDDQAPVGRVDVVFDGEDAIVLWISQTNEGAAALRLLRVSRDGAHGPAHTVASVSAGRPSGMPQLALLGDSLLVAWTDPAAAVPLRTAVLAAE